jgi:hypothetical protein
MAQRSWVVTRGTTQLRWVLGAHHLGSASSPAWGCLEVNKPPSCQLRVHCVPAFYPRNTPPEKGRVGEEWGTF